jgi:hypothetical protein
MCSSHRLLCKIKSNINPVWIKILKIPTVDNFHLINSSKWYHVYKNPTIQILDMKYCHYGLNTLSIIIIIIFICSNTFTINGYDTIKYFAMNSQKVVLYILQSGAVVTLKSKKKTNYFCICNGSIWLMYTMYTYISIYMHIWLTIFWTTTDHSWTCINNIYHQW